MHPMVRVEGFGFRPQGQHYINPEQCHTGLIVHINSFLALPLQLPERRFLEPSSSRLTARHIIYSPNSEYPPLITP